MLALEILDNIFSNLAYFEIYRIRSVCKTWKQQCEHHLYMSIKSNRKKIYVKIGEKGNTALVDMIPSSFDGDNQVIEFKCQPQDDEDEDVYLDQNAARTKAQVHFGDWYQPETVAQHSDSLLDLNIVDRAHVLFHLMYNPPMEQIYELKLSGDGVDEMHYVGDKGIIMTYSYSKEYQEQPQHTNHDVEFRGLEDPIGQNPFNSIFDAQGSTTSNATIRLRIHSIYANISWVLSGLNSSILPEPLYPRRYQVLADTLVLQNADDTHICSYSESVLRCIVTMTQEDAIDPGALSQLLKHPNKEASWREKLQAELQHMGIDPRVIWKYTFVKTYLLQQQQPPSVEPDQVAKIVQESEKAWIIKKLNVIREMREL